MAESIFWQNGNGQLSEHATETRNQLHDIHESGNKAWSKKGIAINRMRDLKAVPYYGEHFDINVAVVYPTIAKDLNTKASIESMFCFFSSDIFPKLVRSIDQAIKVTNKTLLKVPFDLEHWQKIADEKYPN